MQKLEHLHKEISSCTKCNLCKQRTLAVPGEGNFNADVMFIGEAPGRSEDREGKPFVGAAGKFLNELLAAIGYSRDDVFITSILKCRPPGNRDPKENEINSCRPYLEQQIKLIKPKLIVPLGRYAMNMFLPGLKISEVHGQEKVSEGIWNGEQKFFIMYHPAVALYNGSYRQILMDDMKKIPKILSKI